MELLAGLKMTKVKIGEPGSGIFLSRRLRDKVAMVFYTRTKKNALRMIV
jgi:hypothetical protein